MRTKAELLAALEASRDEVVAGIRAAARRRLGAVPARSHRAALILGMRYVGASTRHQRFTSERRTSTHT